MIEVRATERGFYLSLREPGQVFTIPSKDLLGSWMEVVKKPRKPRVKKEPESS